MTQIATGAKKHYLHKTKSEMRIINRKKKEAYYERHGIKYDKNIRRNVTLSKWGRAVEGYDLIYENYKEPLKKIPKTDGYGFYGTVATTSDGEFLQCHVCGNLFMSLSGHVKIHKLNNRSYKEKYGLSVGTVLISDVQRELRQENVFRPGVKKITEGLKEYIRKVQAGEIKHPGNRAADRKGGNWSLEKRNKLGYCPDQLLEKIKELATKLGHTPSEEEFKFHYEYHFIGSIRRIHGSYLAAVRKAKLISAKELKEPSNEYLLAQLIAFKNEHGHVPMTSDFKRGLLNHKSLYWSRFGSLNEARVAAGLEAVIPMPFGQLILMQPDEFIAYKAGRQKVEA